MRRLIALVALIAFASAQPALAAKGDGRTARRFGFFLSFNGDPAPSGVGANLGIQATEFLKLQGGVGVSNPFTQNLGAYAFNYTVVKGFSAFLSLLLWLVKSGANIVAMLFGLPGEFEWIWIDLGGIDYKSEGTMLTYGGGPRLMVPGWALSPAIGMNFAHYRVNGIVDGLTGVGNHVYYTVGLDYQGGSFQAFAGWNHCPSIEAEGNCGFHFNVGFVF